MPKLTPAEIRSALAQVPGWRRRGQALVRTFAFKDFRAALTFTNAVARLAEKACHHPDIDIRWNKVTLVLTTHEEGGLTERDVDLARKCNRLFRP